MVPVFSGTKKGLVHVRGECIGDIGVVHLRQRYGHFFWDRRSHCIYDIYQAIHIQHWWRQCILDIKRM